jgi:uncharacterized membrane protein
MLLFFLGDTTRAVSSLIFGISGAYSLVGDMFWLAGYASIFLALLMQAWPFREAFSTGKFAALLVFAAAVVVLALAILVPLYSHSLANVLLDVLLLLVATLSFIFFVRGSLWRPMLFVIAGVIVAASADILLSWTVSNGTYYSGHPLELLYHWSYLAFALGFFLQMKQVQRAGGLVRESSSVVR